MTALVRGDGGGPPPGVEKMFGNRRALSSIASSSGRFSVQVSIKRTFIHADLLSPSNSPCSSCLGMPLSRAPCSADSTPMRQARSSGTSATGSMSSEGVAKSTSDSHARHSAVGASHRATSVPNRTLRSRSDAVEMLGGGASDGGRSTGSDMSRRDSCGPLSRLSGRSSSTPPCAAAAVGAASAQHLTERPAQDCARLSFSSGHTTGLDTVGRTRTRCSCTSSHKRTSSTPSPRQSIVDALAPDSMQIVAETARIMHLGGECPELQAPILSGTSREHATGSEWMCPPGSTRTSLSLPSPSTSGPLVTGPSLADKMTSGKTAVVVKPIQSYMDMSTAASPWPSPTSSPVSQSPNSGFTFALAGPHVDSMPEEVMPPTHLQRQENRTIPWTRAQQKLEQQEKQPTFCVVLEQAPRHIGQGHASQRHVAKLAAASESGALLLALATSSTSTEARQQEIAVSSVEQHPRCASQANHQVRHQVNQVQQVSQQVSQKVSHPPSSWSRSVAGMKAESRARSAWASDDLANSPTKFVAVPISTPPPTASLARLQQNTKLGMQKDRHGRSKADSCQWKDSTPLVMAWGGTTGHWPVSSVGHGRLGERRTEMMRATGLNASTTTLMIRNLPSFFGQESLVAFLGEDGLGAAYDFIYAPADRVSQKSLGYAFINARTAALAAAVGESLLAASEDISGASGKIIAVEACKLQGMRAIRQHFQRKARSKTCSKPIFVNRPCVASAQHDHFAPAMTSAGGTANAAGGSRRGFASRKMAGVHREQQRGGERHQVQHMANQAEWHGNMAEWGRSS